tara:strand:+ start:465 stop:599 length:135 start_codon:yes stop_codon:yes gene_type:complete
MRKIFIDPGALSPELSATAHEPRTCQTFDHAAGIIIFLSTLANR